MNVQSLKNLLIGVTVASGLGTAAIAVWGFWNSSGDHDEPVAPLSVGLERPPATQNTALDFDGLQDLCLQGPRMVAPIVPYHPPEPTIPQKNNFPIQLLSTMQIDGGAVVGLFRDGTGTYDVKSAGQLLELMPNGVEVKKLEPGLALLAFDGQTIQQEIYASVPTVAAPTTNIEPPSPMGYEAIPVDSMELPAQRSGEPSFTPPARSVVRPTVNITPSQPYRPVTSSAPKINTPAASADDDIFAPLPDNMNPAKFSVPPFSQPVDSASSGTPP